MSQLSKNDEAQIGRAINNEADLSLFLKKMARFNEYFCGLMFDRIDFNIRLEVRGNNGKLLHCRLMIDDTERPLGKSPSEVPEEGN